MGLFDRFIKREEPTPEVTPPVDDVLLKALLEGETITREKAMTLPAVSGAVDMISGSIASMPVKLYKVKQDKVEEVKGDPRVKLLNCDTGDTLDAYQMKKAMVEDYLMGKGGYCYIQKQRNEVTGLYYVEDRYITIWKTYSPIHKQYQIFVNGFDEAGREKNAGKFKPYDFIKLLRNTKDGASGVGLTVEISKELETAYQTLLYQLGMVKAGGNKRGFLKANRKLGQEEINALKTAWRNLYGNNSENVVVLNNGLEFQEASNSSVEMQLNENKRTLQEEINNLFHISNDFDMTFKLAIYPIVKAFETALNRDLLLEKEKEKYFFKFDVKETIRANVRERYESYKLAKETGFMTINEIRKEENLNWIDGMDVVNVGLGAVLYDTNIGKYFTPNTGETTDITEGSVDALVEGHELEQAYDESGNSAERSQKTIAVDFDNTLTDGDEVNVEAIEKIKELQKDNKIVLWTLRTGDALDYAVNTCKKYGLVFDDIIKGKPDVDAFVDDKAVNIANVIKRYNDTHDAKTGRFGTKSGSGSSSSSSSESGFNNTSSSDGSGSSSNVDKSGDMSKNESTEISATGSNTFTVRGFRSKQKLNNHFSKHREQYESIGIKSPEELNNTALKQCESPVGGDIVGHKDGHHNVIRYNTKTKLFTKGDPDRGINTAFIPENPDSYYKNMKAEDLKHGGED